MQEYIDKAKILVEALPFIKEFYKKIVVVKYGGSALTNEGIKSTVMQDIALMKFVGMLPVVVHGGGPEINKMLDRAGVKSEFVGGFRVTDSDTMEIVEMVLSGKINKDITTQLNSTGIKAVGISGKDGGMLKAEKRINPDYDLGYVGDIVSVDTDIINVLLDKDFVPVISSVACDEKGNSYNVNADYAAIAIAGALSAQKLVFLTDVLGILRDVHDSKSFIPEITAVELEEMLLNGSITGGMIPKTQCCIEAVKAGVKNVHILDGRMEHCLLLEIFTKYGIGTMIK